jgi:RimJ/RimL family protein N-acetyltransferase
MRFRNNLGLPHRIPLEYANRRWTNTLFRKSILIVRQSICSMAFPAQFQTDRLTLRWQEMTDAEAMLARYTSDVSVCRFMSWRPHQSLSETEDFIRRGIDERELGSVYNWLIFLRQDESLLGSIGFGVRPHQVQFGYCLARDAWGNGYATEAALKVVEVALEDAAIWRVQAYCDVEHPASARVLEKAGLNLEGTLKKYIVLPNLGEVPRDVLIYARVRGE